MKKPNRYIMGLAELGTIINISIEYRQTGTDTAESYITFCNGETCITGIANNYADYFFFVREHNRLVRLEPYAQKQYDEWIEFEKENAIELKEYKRLKEKFG